MPTRGCSETLEHVHDRDFPVELWVVTIDPRLLAPKSPGQRSGGANVRDSLVSWKRPDLDTSI
jgi:hypothetical protein